MVVQLLVLCSKQSEIILESIETTNHRLFSRNLQMTEVTDHEFRLEVTFDTFDADVQKAKESNEDWTTQGSIDDKVDAVKLAILKVQNYMKSFFNVSFPDELKIPETKCGGNKYPFGPLLLKKVDFYLFVYLQNNENSESPVQALNCLVEKSNGRPVVGIFFINMLKTPESAPDVYQLFKRYLHEFFHMLGYSSYVFRNFPKTLKEGELVSTGNLTTASGNPIAVSYFTNAEVKSAAQSYFNCSTLEGLPLEFGSEAEPTSDHAAFLQQPYSLMNAVPSVDPVIDELAIAVLGSSGWYKIGPGAAEKDVWRGFDETVYEPVEPCDAVTRACPAVLHRCSVEQATANATRCAPDLKSKELCAVHPKYGNLSDDLQCPMWQRTTQYCRDEGGSNDGWNEAFETRSNESLCFLIAEQEVTEDLLIPSCLKYECSSQETVDGNITLLILHLANGTDIECTTQGLLVTVDPDDPEKIITTYCPDPLSLCPDVNAPETTEVETTPACHIDCTVGGFGLCMTTDECFCFFGSDNTTTSGCRESPPEETQSTSGSSSSTFILKSVTSCLFLLLWSIFFE
jgi:hypothetical protein